MPRYRAAEDVSGARVLIDVDVDLAESFQRARGAVPVFLDVARILAGRLPLRELHVNAYDASIFMNALFGGDAPPARLYMGWGEWEGYGLSSAREIADTLAFLGEVGEEQFDRAVLGVAVGALGGVLDGWRLDGHAVSARGRVGESSLEIKAVEGPKSDWRIALRWDKPGLGAVGSLFRASAVAILNRPGALRAFAEGHRFLRRVLGALPEGAAPGGLVLLQSGFAVRLDFPPFSAPLGDVRAMGDPRGAAGRILGLLGKA